MNTFKIKKLTLIGTRKNYSIAFQDGLNYISGPTSTGKTSIFEMIDYALGSKKHKSYIEIGNSCTDVELEINIGKQTIKIKRKLFDFTAPVIVETWDDTKQKYLFYNRFEVDSPSNENSLSAYLLEQLGLSNIKAAGQSFSFRDLFKYSYLKQTEIDNEDILDEKMWAKNNKRKATFEIIFNIYDELLQELRVSQKQKEEELKELRIKMEGIQEFISNTDFDDSKKYADAIINLTKAIEEDKLSLSKTKQDKGITTNKVSLLREKIRATKASIRKSEEVKSDQEQYVTKLRLLLNQYKSEVDRKSLAIEGYLAFNEYEYLFCPNCLSPLEKVVTLDSCCLCGSERSGDAEELLLIKKEIKTDNRKINELIKFIEEEEKKLSDVSYKTKILLETLNELETELQLIYKDYISPNIEQIEYLSYEIGHKNRKLFELQNNAKMLDEITRYEKQILSKTASIENLKERIRHTLENSVDKEELIKTLSEIFTSILESFKYPKLSASYIDEKNYLPYVRNQKYDDVGSLAAVTLITMAYYLTIMLGSLKGDYSHLRVLMIDSPRKNLGSQANDTEDAEFRAFLPVGGNSLLAYRGQNQN